MRVLAVFVLVSSFGLWVRAQDDPDPNSPTPILLSEATTIRALAQSERAAERVPLTRIEPSQAFPADSRVVIYIEDIELMDGEGASAFRVYATDKLGHTFAFPVLDVKLLEPTYKKIFAMTIQLTDAIGYWPAPGDGDVDIYVAWRGLASNTVKLGIGSIGSDEVPPGSKPTPLGTTAASLNTKNDSRVSPKYVGYRWSGDRRRFLEQATFGPTQALDDRIRRIGLKVWLSEQFAAPYATVLPNCPNGQVDMMAYPCQPLKTGNQGSDPTCDGDNSGLNNNPIDIPTTCSRDTYTMYPVQTWFMKYALHGDAQLRHRVAWSLGQIWVNSGVDVQQSRHMVEYHKILSNNAFGNYRTLMKQMTLSPTMGDYLSMALSTKNSPNENYAREIMQLFTVGLFMLNPDGTLQLDGTGNPIPSYDQTKVNNLTKVLTGWSFCQTQASCPNLALGTVNYIDPMLLNNNNHDLTAKTLLDYSGAVAADRDIAACAGCTGTAIATYANASLDHAIDNIYNHPNVAPFVCKTLIQHMVTSDPTPAYVGRVAAVFNANRANPTQMKEVVKAILLDVEARGDTKTDPNYGKLREPVQLATNILRMFNARSADGLSQSDGYLLGRSEFTGMAQVQFMSPTVFNFYPPSYVVPGTALLGPEFAVMNTSTSIQRANFVNRFVFSAPAIPVGAPNAPLGTSLDLSDLQALSTADSTGNLLVDELSRRMLHGTMPAAMKSTILPAVTSVAASDSLGRSRQAIYLIATSHQYQVQR